MSNINTYLQYGISTDIAKDLISKNLSISSIRSTSLKNMINTYHFDEVTAKFVKNAVLRKEIDENIIYQLLKNSLFKCCCCEGTKSPSYVIHHIIEHHINQDNSYDNLAVLCPACHDIAHSNGLSRKLTPEQIKRKKGEWEKEVEKNRVSRASLNLEIHDIDFINAKRIDILGFDLFNQINDINKRNELIDNNIIDKNGNYIHINKKITNNHIISGNTINHYKIIFKHIISYFLSSIENIDNLVNKEVYNKIGSMCYYVGGLYGKALEDKCTLLHFSRKKYTFNWIVDNNYIISNTSAIRMKQRSIYIVYGIIRSVEYNKEKKQNIVDLRPYFIGMPTKTINRTPKIRYTHDFIEDDHEDL
ncbi:HNH endonuclease [Herpetosiphon giganteus]|uniref:HNH endonuclease n=1 Tax=Herpetosiphon giganteus TaxID=2029754 RepID=UPI0019592EAD|nr:HNH endonuclease [Herpetosiphon giganteus]MBM7843019.1 5-methylcytosine-specific restriction endonuclease McrA [Herpetosiphon giganteus]